MAGADIELIVGLHETTQSNIHKGLLDIVNNIGDLKVKVGVDENSLSALKASIEKAVKDAAKVKVTPSVGSVLPSQNASGKTSTTTVVADTNKQITALEKLKFKYQELTKTYSEYEARAKKLGTSASSNKELVKSLEEAKAILDEMNNAISGGRVGDAKFANSWFGDIGKTINSELSSIEKIASKINSITDSYNKASEAATQYGAQMDRVLSSGASELVSNDQIEAVREYQRVVNDLGNALTRGDFAKAQELAPNLTKLGVAARQASQDATKLESAYNSATNKFQNLAARAQEYSTKISNTASKGSIERIQAMARRWQDFATNGFGKALEEWNTKFNGGAPIDETAIKRFAASATAEFARFRTEMELTGQTTETFGQKLKRIFGSRINYAVTTMAVMYARQAFRELLQSAIELDSAFAQLQIVTGATDAEMAKFKNTASGLAQDLGKSVADIAGSIEVFSRLGYSLPDASELAKIATIMSNVAAVGTDEATTGMTSIIKGFNMDVDNAEHVADVLVDVGQKYAVSAGEMMEAFERSGAALNATGTSFEKSAGLIAAANAAVQDASTVGTALKTVSARIRGSKSDLESLGESTEGLANGFSKYAEELKALTGFDIRVEGTTDQFKDLYDIMGGVAQVWDKLTDTQQARVSEILGGTRQLQVISSILGNWGDAVGAYETAMNSAGAATRANSIYMDTAAAHIEQMKAAFETMSNTVVDSSLIAGVADFVKIILQGITGVTKLVDSLGGLKAVLAAIVALNISKITSFISILPTTVSMLWNLNVPGAIKAILSPLRDLRAAWQLAGEGATGLAGTLKNLIPTLIGAGSAAELATGGILALVGVIAVINAYKKHLEEVRSATIENGRSAAEEAENLRSLYKEYDSAKAAYDGSIESKQALISASDALCDALGKEKGSVDKLSESYKELTLEKLNSAKYDAKAAITAARKDLVDSAKGNWYSDIIPAERSVNNTIRMAGAEVGVNPVSWLLSDEEKADGLIKIYANLINKRNELINSGKEETAEFENVTAAIQRLKPSVENLQDAESNLDDIMDALGETAFNTADSIDNVGNSISKAGGTFKDIFTGNISESIDNVQNKISSLSEALGTLESGSMGVEDVIDLLQQFPELAEYVDLTADGFGSLDVGLKRVISDAPKELINTLTEFKRTHDLTEAQTRQIDSLSDALRNLPEDSVSSLSEEFGVLADNIRRAGEEQTELEKKLAEDDYDKGYDERLKNFEAYQKVLDEGEYGSKAFAAYSEYFGLMEKTTAEIDTWMEANKKYFAEGQDGIIAWTETLSELTKSGALEGIASYSEETGLFTYDVTKLDEFAEKLGWTEGMLQDFISKYRMYVSDWQDYSGTDLRNMFTDAGLIGGAAEGSVVSMARLMEYTGKTKQEVQEMIDLINQDQPDSWLKGIDDSFLKSFSDRGFSSSLEGIKTDMMQLKSVVQGLGIDWNEFVEDGFSNFETTLQPILEGIGWTDEMIAALRDQLVDPFVVAFSTIGTDSLSDVIAKLHHYNIDVTVNDDGALVVTQGLVDSLYEATGNAQSTIDLIDQLAARDDVEVEADLKLGDSNINDLLGTEEGATTVTVDIDVNGETVRADITTLASDIQTILGDAGTIDLTAEDVDATTKTQLLKTLIDGLVNNGVPYVASLNADTGDSVTSLDDVLSRINSILNSKDSKTLTVTTYYKTVGKKPGEFATGTRRAPAGPALLGDEYSPTGDPKPELVVSKGNAYIAGINGPVLSNLNAGDIVYTADETKKILGGSNIVRLPAFAGGTANGLKKTGSTSTSVSSYSGTSGKAVTAAAKEAAKDVSEAVEDQLKELKEKVDDILDQFEFDIFMAEQHNASSEEIIAIYKRMQQTVHEQAEKYRKMGVDENNEYIRNLKKQWWEYEESIREARKKEFDERVKDSQFAIEVMEHDEDGVDKILDSWRTILRSINDEIAYYSTRGYDIASDEIQDLMKEAWDAEEQIEEILDKALDKVNSSIDHIQDVFKSFTDASSQWDESQYLSLDTLQDLIDLGIEYMACLDDENGMLVINKEAIAKMLAAKAQQLAVEGALNYVRRIGLALEKGESEELNRLLTATQDTTSATWDLVYANLAFLNLSKEQYDAAYKNLDKMRSIADNVSDHILDSLNAESDSADSASKSMDDMEDALEKIIDYTKDLIKHEHEEMKDALDDQLDMYKKIVDEKKKSLDLTKSELSYNKDISNRTSEIAKLQAQADALALDDSREAQIKRAKILEEIAKKQEELEEKQRDHSIDLQKEALDKRVEVFEDAINDQKEDIDKEISSEEKLYQLALDRLKNSDWDELKKQLLDWNTEYGTSLNKEITEAWDKATEAVQKYGSVVKALEELGKTPESEQEEEKPSSGIVSNKYEHNDVDYWSKANEMRSNSIKYLTSADPDERKWLANRNAQLASELEALGLYRDDHGAWHRKDGSLLYNDQDKLEKEIMEAISAVMKQNSIAWWTASEEERARLAADNKYIAEHSNGRVSNNNGTWVDKSGNALYSISGSEKEAIAKQLVSMMKSNSSAWSSASPAEQQRLSAENVRIADSIASLLNAKVTRDDSGVWYINGEKLYDKYHSGGIVGGGSIKDNERFALLNKGEMVLSDTQKKTLEHLLAVGQMLRDKSSLLADSVFGGIVNNIASNSMKGIRNQLPGDLNKPTQIVQVDASLTVSGAVDDDVLRVIKRHPDFVAEQVAKVII